MFMTPFDPASSVRTLNLVWNMTGLREDERLGYAALLPTGHAIAVDHAMAARRIRAANPRLCVYLREDERLMRLGADGTPAETLFWVDNILPSQLGGDAPRCAAALDIVMRDTTKAAWAAMAEIVDAGLTPANAAAALVGTPGEIARRLAEYRAGGLRHVVLTAPPERAPYMAVERELMPLLTAMRRTPTAAAHRAQSQPGTIGWHGVAL
ncbi:hypothetical protein [Brytella acorum]|uniref:Uncharacterized protein n=1 Tax=Brytella acorum TaxID=2959299 RepID=A0AA35UJT9_9PROT|nr:hypothetical protein [Brytella acorum]CAI9121667.1 hypothetical protein LMG32879_002516 [Brytella acorum]